MESDLQSGNINSIWLKSIGDDLKLIGDYIGYAYEGCNTLPEYILMVTQGVQHSIPDLRYKNLKLIISRFSILVPRLGPIIGDKVNLYLNSLSFLQKDVHQRKLFIAETHSSVTKHTTQTVTPFFNATLEQLEELHRKLIMDVAHLLYLGTDSNKEVKNSPRIA